MEGLEYSYLEVEDESFEVDKVEVAPQEVMANAEESLRYIFKSDIVTGLYAVGDGLIITTEGGEVEMDGLRPVNYYDKRFKRFYRLNKQLELQEGIISKVRENQNNCLIISNGVDLYNIILEEGPSEAKYVLNKMIF